MSLGSDQFANIVSIVALAISAVLAILYVRDRRHAKYAIENEYASQLLCWHAAVVDVLIELGVLSGDGTEGRKKELLVRLSSLIEQGRFYFPNIKQQDYGLEKPPAYRGYRNLTLDFLVASYNLHHKPRSAKLEKQAKHLQQLFTSVIYEIIRPMDRLNMIRELTDRYFVKDLSIEDLELQEQIEAVSHIWKTPE